MTSCFDQFCTHKYDIIEGLRHETFEFFESHIEQAQQVKRVRWIKSQVCSIKAEH